MRYFNALFGWLWRRKLFIGITLASALLFMFWNFPFNDLSDAATSTISRMSNNQFYVQATQLNVHVFPQPALSAEGLRVESGVAPITAKWAKVTPGLFSMLLNLRTFIGAARGQPEATQAVASRVSFSVDAEGLWGGDADLNYGPGKKSEAGVERSRIDLMLKDVNLQELGEWAELPVPLKGRAHFTSDLQLSTTFQEQPEGDYELKIAKFSMPAGVVNVPVGEASFPINLPALSLADVVLKGRLIGGNFIIEEGAFGKSQDPLYGRIKGQLAVRFIPTAAGPAPQFGVYKLTVDLNANAAILRDLGLIFIPLDSAKEVTSSGGAHYLFQAQGDGIGMMHGPPSITRIPSF